MKGYFLTRALREKILLVVLVVGAAAMWLSSAGERAGRLWRQVQATSTDLRVQEMVLGQREEIEARSHAAVERLDPARTFDPVRLQSEVNTIANLAGLGAKTNISGAPTDSAGQIAVHSVQVTVNNADYPSLVKFYTELQKRSPYLGIEQFDLLASPPGSANLRQSLRVSSVEIVR
jgi:hypothetical protein